MSLTKKAKHFLFKVNVRKLEDMSNVVANIKKALIKAGRNGSVSIEIIQPRDKDLPHPEIDKLADWLLEHAPDAIKDGSAVDVALALIGDQGDRLADLTEQLTQASIKIKQLEALNGSPGSPTAPGPAEQQPNASGGRLESPGSQNQGPDKTTTTPEVPDSSPPGKKGKK